MVKCKALMGSAVKVLSLIYVIIIVVLWGCIIILEWWYILTDQFVILSNGHTNLTDNVSFCRGEYQCHMPLTVQICTQKTTIFNYKCCIEYTRQNLIMAKNWISICLICDMAWSNSSSMVDIFGHQLCTIDDTQPKSVANVHVHVSV